MPSGSVLNGGSAALISYSSLKRIDVRAPPDEAAHVRREFKALHASRANASSLSPTMFRPYGLKPGVPAERVTALRKAFTAMAHDAVFLAEAEKAKRDISFTPAETMQSLLESSAKTPKATLEKVGTVITPK